MPVASSITRRGRKSKGVSHPYAPLVHLVLTALVEEKYGKNLDAGSDEEEEDSEEDVSEDDDGELITEDLDAAINETLQAIRSRDPRVYDEKVKFYRDEDEGADEGDATTKKKEKPMTLKDYHTKNLLEGKVEVDEEEDAPPKTYAQEQEEVRQTLLKEMHADAGSDDDEDDFLVAKSKPEKKDKKGRPVITEKDVEQADKDPETFLSNFMASRAWVPTEGTHWKPLESDDDEEDERAETFEAAYNMYFEDPAGTNEKIVTYARDAVAATSVRREEPSGRKKAREAARAKREAEKREREQEMARLRKLRIEEMEEKVKRIRECAGLSGKDFKMEEWADVLDADWSDDQWDAEMRKRFGEDYYAGKDGDVESDDEDEDSKKKKKKKPKKPKWDDDIDIYDLIPDFEDEETAKPDITLSSDEEGAAEDAMEVDDEDEDDEQSAGKKHKSSKQRKQERAEAKSATRRDRRLIERLVDSQLEADIALASKSSSKNSTRFRYRETSPTTFGLTARDILLADDAALNQFAGLKKLATFRDPAKKKKDKKALSKKARLRQWRAETFGNEEGPQGGFELLLGDEAEAEVPQKKRKHVDAEEGGVDIREGEKKKKRRSRKKKGGVAMES